MTNNPARSDALREDEACVFVPAHEPWSCSTHVGGYRTLLTEDRCSVAAVFDIHPPALAAYDALDSQPIQHRTNMYVLPRSGPAPTATWEEYQKDNRKGVSPACDYLRRNPPVRDDCECGAFEERDDALDELREAIITAARALAAPAAEPREEFRNDIECYCRRGLTESCWSHRHRWVDTGEELAHVACEPHGHDESAAAQPGPSEPGLADRLARLWHEAEHGPECERLGFDEVEDVFFDRAEQVARALAATTPADAGLDVELLGRAVDAHNEAEEPFSPVHCNTGDDCHKAIAAEYARLAATRKPEEPR